ncbi:MAG: hypothetical protein CL916_11640 [Deltaproteobacteria bacterium]|nr:hypothetical protein [Deltaproteobacteria bacterium]
MMKWSMLLMFSMGCSSWELTHAEKDISSCWFSPADPVPVQGGLDWGIAAADMNVGYDFPYDGIDQNCDGASEFDLDGDGFIPAPFAIDGQVDCWDAPTTPVDGITGNMIIPDGDEVAYDGIDQNCDGLLDFDVDGDGFGSQEYEGEFQYRWAPRMDESAIASLKGLLEGLNDEEKQQLIDTYFSSFEQDTQWEAGDCWDDPQEERESINDFDLISADEVFPDADERYYDGIDQNCDGESDFDQDGDGFASSQYLTEEGVIGEDCNDTDENLFPNLEIEEIYYNGIDDNCDGRDADGDQDGDGFWDAGYWDVVSPDDIDISVQIPDDDIITDCNDQDVLIYPGATERCNGIDDSCDTDLPIQEQDVDGDGFVSCSIDQQGWLGVVTDGFSGMAGEDCDDGDVLVYPNATEFTGDGIDQSCDGLEVCYTDIDGDGFRGDGTVETINIDCSGVGEKLASVEVDCDDGSASTYPGAAYLDSTTDCMLDGDGDGFGSDSVSNGVTLGSDCNDGDVNIQPNATEVCDGGIDNDCDGVFDDDDSDVDLSTGTVHYADIDEDGFGDNADSSSSCIVPQDRTTDNTDCDDDNALINPQTMWFEDTDNDGFGSVISVQVCNPGNGYVLQDGDCDDDVFSINPNATELTADGVDQNCDTLESCYRDDDTDSFGSTSTTPSEAFDLSCTGTGVSSQSTDCDDSSALTYPGAAYLESLTDCMLDGDGDGFGADIVSSTVDAGSDCDDTDDLIHPNATEVCDGIDNDCDSLLDDADTDWDQTTGVIHYADTDVDTYGDPNDEETTCIVPSGRVTNDDDCDDTNPTLNPDTIWYEDADEDGFGSSLQTQTQCESPTGFVLNGDDCDDGNPEITEGWSWYADTDGDGIGVASNPVLGCSAPTGYVHHNGDCDDGDIQNAEICLNLWEGITINGAGSGVIDSRDRDRFASHFDMGSVNGKMMYGFGTPFRKYSNKSDVGGAFFFESLTNGSTLDSHLRINPSGTLKQFGSHVMVGEDFTGDGKGDVLVSSYVDPPSMYIFDGLDVTTSSGELTEQDALYTIDGSLMNDRMGSRVFWADITGDQQKDLIFNQPEDASITIIHDNLSSMTIDKTVSSSDYLFLEGEDSADHFGHDFDIVDIDQDGDNDIIVGDYKFAGNDGRVYIRLGPILSGSGNTAIGTGNLYIDTDSTDSKPRFGKYTRAFDWDEDGAAELIVLEQRKNGPQCIYMYDLNSLATINGFGSITSFLNTTPALLSSSASSLGIVSLNSGEFDILSMDIIDGYLAIGAPKFNGDNGAVALFAYEDRLTTHASVNRTIAFSPENAQYFISNDSIENARLGSVVKNVGDVTGDGYDDLLIGARQEDGGEGKVRILPGPF